MIRNATIEFNMLYHCAQYAKRMDSFKETGLDDQIIKAITEMGYEKPTPIQAESIPQLIDSKRDIIATAQTGTGKTAAFGLPALHKTDLSYYKPQTLVLCPTRELCMQITRDLNDFGKYLKGFEVLAVYGGARIETQIRALKRGVHIVVATPGRAKDLINRRKLDLSTVNYVVLDEADEMLNMGFKEDLDAILSETDAEKQTLLFSATMSKEILRISKNYMEDPVHIKVAAMNKAAENVEHIYYMVQARNRYALLKRVVDMNPGVYAIIFCRTRRETNMVATKLGQDGYNADFLNGDLSQGQRDTVMRKFRDGSLQLLVATDVAARGLDVNNLTHVINFNLPDDPEVYVHRSGRTGRAGRSGVSIAIVHSREGRKIRDIEKKGGIRFTKKNAPTPEDIIQTQLVRVVEKIRDIKIKEKDIAPFLPEIMESLEAMSKEDIIKSVVYTEFSRFLDYYKNQSNIDVADKKRGDRDDRRDRRDRDRGRGRDRDRDRGRGRDRDGRNEGRQGRERNDRSKPKRAERGDSQRRKTNSAYARMFINVGSKQNLDPPRLLEMIGESLNTNAPAVGSIDILKKFSFFEIGKDKVKKVIDELNGSVYENVQLQVEESEEKPFQGFVNRTKQKKNSFQRSAKRKSFQGNTRSKKSDRFKKAKKKAKSGKGRGNNRK